MRPLTGTSEVAAHAAELAAERAGLISGKVVGVFGRYLPPELPAALGLDPAVVAFPTSAGAMRRGDDLVRTDSCRLCRAMLGAPEDEAPWVRRLGLLAAGSACDQQRRMIESFGRLGAVEVFAFGVPRTTGENARQRYGEQLDRLARVLEAKSGVRLQENSLRAAVDGYRRLRARLREFRPRLPFAEFVGLVADGFFLGPERALPLLESAGTGGRREPPVRLLLAGSCLGRSDARQLAEALPAGEADFVDDATGTVAGVLETEVPSGTKGLAGVATAYFGQAEIARRPNDAYYAHLLRKAAEVRADAVVFRFVKFCDVNAAEALRVKAALAPRPVLFLDEEPGGGAQARRRTRIEALLEGLRCRRA